MIQTKQDKQTLGATAYIHQYIYCIYYVFTAVLHCDKQVDFITFFLSQSRDVHTFNARHDMLRYTGADLRGDYFALQGFQPLFG